jgi:acyl carrier protein
MSALEEVKRIIARIAHGNADEIVPETALKEIKADSLHWVQIIVAVESAFEIEIDFEEMQELTTIQDFVAYIEKRAR